MATKIEEDFWNTSSSSGFNFDDEEDTNEPHKDFVFSSALEESSSLPIHSLISKAGLDLILDDVKSTKEYTIQPVSETIRKMSNNQAYSLEVYKRFVDKMLLLDAALGTMDGNIILNVILFLKNTLRQNIFHHQISKRKLAVRHYASYLIVKNCLEDLSQLYMATGHNSFLKQVYHLKGRGIRNKETYFKVLENVMLENLLLVNDEKQELSENLQFLRWQIDKNENCGSVIEQLAALCKTQWEKNKNSNDVIMEYKKQLKIDDFAFEWTAMNVLSSMQMWSQLTSLFMKPNWLTKKHSLKTVMCPEIFVHGLSMHQPPKEILEQYLSSVTDSEKSLYLGIKLNCHKFVIQQYINQKDRLALIAYKSKVSSQDQNYFLIEHALQSSLDTFGFRTRNGRIECDMPICVGLTYMKLGKEL